MALASLDDLRTAVQEWLDRSDIAGRADDFVALAHDEMNDLIRHPDMIIEAELSLTNRQAAKPSGFLQHYNDPINPDCWNVTVIGGTLTFDTLEPSVTFRYYQEIPELTGSSTNWLFDLKPAVYLFGAQHEALSYINEFETARAQRVTGRFYDLIGRVNEAGVAASFANASMSLGGMATP